MKHLIATLAFLTCTLNAGAATAEPPVDATASMPAFIDFERLTADYGEPRVMVNLSAALLRLAAAAQHREPALSELLNSLESVRVQVYDTSGETAPAAARLRDAGDRLRETAWENIVRVREDGELVDIYVKQDAGRIQGMTVMAVDREESVFINVVGDIRPSQLQRLVDGMRLDMDLDLSLARAQ